MKTSNVGICDMALYVPKLSLSIRTLAEKRNLEFGKLNKGLGLERMIVPDVHEDAATMAANAVHQLMVRQQLKPQDIGRIYLGTESALDGAKPTATYVLEMLRRKYKENHGPECFRNCDVVDLTFACIGAVDALQNTLDWVRGKEGRIGIVVASDFAKYELNSGGEYTQGSGAIALLVKHQPKLLTIEDPFGVATQGVHDFFKPRRTVSKSDLMKEFLQLSSNDGQSADELLEALPNSLDVNGVLDSNEDSIQVFKDTPVFDGQYSNWTYQNRIREAYMNFCDKKNENMESPISKDYINTWDRMIFHLPYAFHGKRIASELFMMSLKQRGIWKDFSQKIQEEPQIQKFESQEAYEASRIKFLRSITKTEEYKEFVHQKLEKAQRASSLVGNMYACSIFLALMSCLESDLNEGTVLTHSTFGFVAYGSGSKSKVFEGHLQSSWKEVVANFNVFDKLNSRKEISYDDYEQIHRKQLTKSIYTPSGEFALDRVGQQGVRLGARYYKWEEKIE